MGGLVTFEIAFRVAEPTQDCEGSLGISEIFFGAAYMGGLSLSLLIFCCILFFLNDKCA
jgi:hypothetical protein